VPGRYLRDKQHVQAWEEDGVGVEVVAGQQAASLGARERPRRAIVQAVPDAYNNLSPISGGTGYASKHR
jgi:hypothetical protein